MQICPTRAESQTVKVAQPGRGTAFSITDETIAKIERHVAAHDPERGGVLIVPRDSRVVMDFLADPRPGQQVSYWHSDALRTGLADYLRCHANRRYAGTLHSHPGAYAEPSGPDHDAFATTLADNPSVREPLFPIVVRAPRSALGPVLRLGDHHLLDLTGGTLAAYSAVPNGESVTVRPAPINLVPLRADITAAADLLTARTGRAVVAGATTELEVEGRYLPAVPVRVDGELRSYVVFPETYPTQPPLVIGLDSTMTAPAWMIGGETVPRLAEALGETVPTLDPAHQTVCQAPSTAGTVSDQPMATETETMTARLGHHLPGGVAARFLVIGAGSVGSNAAEMLVRSGATDLTILDFDTVEAANLSRTIYTRDDTGLLKVDALVERLRAINPEVTVTGLAERIQDLDLGVLDAVDLVVLASDDMAAEFWLGHHLYDRRIRSVSIKMFERGDAGEIVVIDPTRGTPCLRCLIGDPAAERGATDYGTGRIVAAPALGADIVATVARGVRVALALGQERGPLADWIAPLLDRGRVYFQHASVGDWKQISHFRSGGISHPFDSMWAVGEPQHDCGVCGTDPAEPARTFEIELPQTLPPGVRV